MGFMSFVKWKTPLGSTTFRWMLNESMPSKSTASDGVPVRVRSPAPWKKVSFVFDKRDFFHDILSCLTIPVVFVLFEYLIG